MVDLTSSPEDGGRDDRGGRKRGRDEEDQDNANGSATDATAAAAASITKRRRIVAAPLHVGRSGGAKATGESSSSDDDSDVVCLGGSYSSGGNGDDDDERKPPPAAAAAVAPKHKRRRLQPTNYRGTRSMPIVLYVNVLWRTVRKRSVATAPSPVRAAAINAHCPPPVPSPSMSPDVVDLTSSPEDGGRDDRGGRKRGRDEEDQDNANGSATDATAAAAASITKRRRIVAAPLHVGRSGGAKATGESSSSDDDSDVVCLGGSYSSGGNGDDNDRKLKPPPAAAAVAPKRRRLQSTNYRGTRSVGADEAIDLTSTSPRSNGEAASAASATASAGPSPFATQASTYLDSVRGDLCHDKKQEHFKDARRPEQMLQRELNNLWDQLRSVADRHSEEYRVCRRQIEETEAQLHAARRNAAEDIYNRNNSAERMGRVGADGRLTVDYHGLYKRDAIAAYEEMVLPILPAQTRVAIITGKGRHSKDGKGALRDGLMEHIRQSAQYRERKIQCRVDPKNGGVLLVDWIGR